MRLFIFGLGLASLVASFGWWRSFFQQVRNLTGIPADQIAREALPCLFYTTTPCSLAYSMAELTGNPSYNPVLTWVGFGLILLAIVMPRRKRRKNAKAPTALAISTRIEPRF